jgi:hypothetical protein
MHDFVEPVRETDALRRICDQEMGGWTRMNYANKWALGDISSFR